MNADAGVAELDIVNLMIISVTGGKSHCDKDGGHWRRGCAIEEGGRRKHFSVQSRNYPGSITLCQDGAVAAVLVGGLLKQFLRL